jgi:hypothetical protein
MNGPAEVKPDSTTKRYTFEDVQGVRWAARRDSMLVFLFE